ncbi:hypothetical protein PC111_g4205 [Phytophthora cactorum]|nr:hypothetical protein PC111_g4205 [Phytophthora cactorum]
MLLQLPSIYDEIKMSISEFVIITTVLKERYDFIYDDAHGVSYLTNPRYEGQGPGNQGWSRGLHR